MALVVLFSGCIANPQDQAEETLRVMLDGWMLGKSLNHYDDIHFTDYDYGIDSKQTKGRVSLNSYNIKLGDSNAAGAKIYRFAVTINLEGGLTKDKIYSVLQQDDGKWLISEVRDE